MVITGYSTFYRGSFDDNTVYSHDTSLPVRALFDPTTSQEHLASVEACTDYCMLGIGTSICTEFDNFKSTQGTYHLVLSQVTITDPTLFLTSSPLHSLHNPIHNILLILLKVHKMILQVQRTTRLSAILITLIAVIP